MRLEVLLGCNHVRFQRKSTSKEAIRVEHRERIMTSHLLAVYRIVAIREDERAAATLHESIVGGIDDAPLHTVAEVPERSEDDTEVTTALFGRRLQQAIDILKQDERRLLGFERIVNLPPENALLALDALGPRRSD